MKRSLSLTLISFGFIFLFAGNAILTAPGISASALSRGFNSASTRVIPVTPPGLAGYREIGSASSNFPLILSVAIPLNNLSLLQSMEQAISNPTSPQYRQFLSQQMIQQLFLPVTKYQSTLSYLTSKGFTIVNTAEDSMIIATGTAGLLESALGLSTLLYSNGTYTYYSASGYPSLSGVYVFSSNVTILVEHTSLSVESEVSGGLSYNSSPQQAMRAVPNVTSPIETFQASDLLQTYNASTLVSSGYDGKGRSIGIYEEGGDPYISQELSAYDQETGLPAPSSFSVVPVGPYNPSVGTIFGIPLEEVLDVESSHAMAPGAGMVVYTANAALPWAPVIAVVDQQDAVNVFTMSYGYSENYYAFFGASFFTFQLTLADQYFLIGSAEGITFMSSSGDGGGSGYAAQPAGTMSYPPTSPYVTSVGGTTTYFIYNGSSVVSSYQTAWSGEGFENPLANFGGGTGGVSNIEPKPWYQSSIATPNSYENGRLQPDLSLEANVYPAMIVVVDGRNFYPTSTGFVNFPIGGTSESSPLLAGLIVDLDQKVGGSVGLINPTLYQMGESSHYAKEFTPITFGYITPWDSSYGYNLATGWGAPNIGEWADYFSSLSPGSTPSIQVTITNSKDKPQFEFTAGEKIVVSATPIGVSSSPSDSFNAQLVTLQGTLAQVPLSYNKSSGDWMGKIIVPPTASGISNVNVVGMIGGAKSFGFAQVFTGYLATFNSPFALGTLSWSTLLGLNVSVSITNLHGKPVSTGSFNLSASSYSLASNTYKQYTTRKLVFNAGNWETTLTGNFPTGATLFILDGVFGFDPFLNGVGIARSFIIPPTNSEPGTVSPGQFLEIEGELQAPANTPNIISAESGLPLAETVEIESNLTAALVSPGGQVVSRVNVGPLVVPTSFLGYPANFLGYLKVPNNAGPGLYDIILKSTYQSIDLNGLFFNGSYFGQILVPDQAAIVPKISVSPNPVDEGKVLQIQANIAYANGTEVKYGMFSATLYPAYDSNNYACYSTLPAGEVPLWYDSSLNLWVGNVTMPSQTNLGWLGGDTSFLSGLYPGIVNQPVAGAWDVYISGLSADGVGTTTAISAQQGFTVAP